MFLYIKHGFHQSFVTTRGIRYLPCTRLKNKVAVVTAATAGMGLAIATRLGLEGAKVSISSRDQSNVDRALNELKSKKITAMGTICDVNNADHRKNLLEAVLKEFGEVDILVPNTSKNPPCKILSCPEKEWSEAMDINLKAAYLLTEAAVSIMFKKESGKIVFISSIAGYRYFEMFAGPYSIAKTGLIGLMKTLSWQLAPKGIIVNAVAPGLIDTKSLTEDAQTQEYLQQIPMKRYGTVNDVAAGVAFLASDDASYITGEVIVIGGGMSGRL